MYTVSPLSSLPLPSHHAPSRSSGPSQSTELSSLCYTGSSHELPGLHLIVCVCQGYSFSSSHPLLPPAVSTSLFCISASLFLPYKQVHQYQFSGFLNIGILKLGGIFLIIQRQYTCVDLSQTNMKTNNYDDYCPDILSSARTTFNCLPCVRLF